MTNDLTILEDITGRHKKSIGNLFRALGVEAPVTAKNVYLVFANPDIGPEFLEGLYQITLPEEATHFEGDKSNNGKKTLIGILKNAGSILREAGGIVKNVKDITGYGPGKQDTTESPKTDPKEEEEKIIGLAKPIFYAGTVLLVLIVSYIIYRKFFSGAK